MSARNPLEKFSAIFLVGGVGMFVFAFVTLVASPWWLLRSIPTATVEQMAREPSEAFHDLAKRYPQNFKTAFGEVTPASYASALRRGRDVYVAEACWHCRSQYVRPVSREAERFGRVSHLPPAQLA
ncbi:MAG: cbb3-type cytochrome c oxidase subunit II, partial [bacterium]